MPDTWVPSSDEKLLCHPRKIRSNHSPGDISNASSTAATKAFKPGIVPDAEGGVFSDRWAPERTPAAPAKADPIIKV